MSSPPTRMFQLKVDPLTGQSEWVIIDEEDTGGGGHTGTSTTPSKSLLATTSYLDMLNDTRRNRAFRQAIDNTVTKPCHVLDIGAGTGLLSMMAARAMGLCDSETESKERSGSDGLVTACEAYLPMVKLMRRVLRANKMERKIRILHKRSDEVEVGIDIPSRADILVSEILDSELLGEGLIPTLQHAHDHLLVENPQTVPHRATVFAQLVECTHLRRMHNLVNREAEALDGIHLVPSGMDEFIGIKQKQYAFHCDAIKGEIKLLSEPFEVFEFDFWRRPDSFRETELHIKATNEGIIHAIISWWLLQLDSEGTVFYSTAPNWIHCSDAKGTQNWCDHWKQSVWFCPRSDALHVVKDEELQLRAAHTETSILYNLNASRDKKEFPHHYFNAENCQIVLSPGRNALYGDSAWRCIMCDAIKSALHQTQSPLCLVADDSIFLSVAIAHLSKSLQLLALFPGLGKKAVQYLQLVAAANSYSRDCIVFINDKDLHLILQASQQKKINLFVAEPFYYGNDNALPWQNLRFWKQRTLLDSFLSKDALIMPCGGLLKACAMYLPDLWQSRCCLKEIEGFDHSCVNAELGGCGGLPAGDSGPMLPFFVWQCGETKILSDAPTLLEFDFSKPMSPCSGKTLVQFTESGICHGYVLWIDWVMDAEGKHILSTGPDKRYWRQAVKLLNDPVEIKDCNSSMVEAFFDPSSGELTLQHACPLP
ncbi:protein arginine N-methyltransferase 1.6 isoform X2 [Andrographis paniculata]|nr:protein arginine N-methyltransferase 1.6 isoform X2 [Andrographis paniculata]